MVPDVRVVDKQVPKVEYQVVEKPVDTNVTLQREVPVAVPQMQTVELLKQVPQTATKPVQREVPKPVVEYIEKQIPVPIKTGGDTSLSVTGVAREKVTLESVGMREIEATTKFAGVVDYQGPPTYTVDAVRERIVS